ncbi:MAG: acyl carrier protein, partial [Myxococcota bacterium]
TQLIDVIAEVGELDDRSKITDDADLFQDLGLDSMQALEIVLEMEQQLNLSIPEERLREIRSLGDAVRLAKELA